MLHELTHVYDQMHHGFIRWRILYALSKTWRRYAEFKAYAREIKFLQKRGIRPNYEAYKEWMMDLYWDMATESEIDKFLERLKNEGGR